MSELKYKGFVIERQDNSPMKFSDVPLDKLPLTMSYIPMQKLGEVYSEYDALCRGTLFPALDKPFFGKFTEAKK